jgi:phospholipase/carboxylesterase
MKTTDGLIHEATYSFAFRTMEPRPDAPRTLLVLLHGVGGDEEQLAPLGERVALDTLVVLPRGPRSISGERLGWFREGLSEDGPQVVEDEAEEARLKLIEFIGQLQDRFHLPPSRTVVGGFSQGGILGASVALTAPQCMAGFAVMGGRLMPELEPRLAPTDELARLRALIVHGRHDETLPVEWAERATGWLAHLEIAHEVHLHDAGHELAPAMEDDFLRWFCAPGQPWHRAEPDRPAS